MPTGTKQSALPRLNHGQIVHLRRMLVGRAIDLMQFVFLAQAEPTFDDLITLSYLISIGISEDGSQLPFLQWLDVFKFHVRTADIFADVNMLDEEGKEERRR